MKSRWVICYAAAWLLSVCFCNCFWWCCTRWYRGMDRVWRARARISHPMSISSRACLYAPRASRAVIGYIASASHGMVLKSKAEYGVWWLIVDAEVWMTKTHGWLSRPKSAVNGRMSESQIRMSMTEGWSLKSECWVWRPNVGVSMLKSECRRRNVMTECWCRTAEEWGQNVTTEVCSQRSNAEGWMSWQNVEDWRRKLKSACNDKISKSEVRMLSFKSEVWWSNVEFEGWSLIVECWSLKVECWRLKYDGWLLMSQVQMLKAEVSCLKVEFEGWRLMTEVWLSNVQFQVWRTNVNSPIRIQKAEVWWTNINCRCFFFFFFCWS